MPMMTRKTAEDILHRLMKSVETDSYGYGRDFVSGYDKLVYEAAVKAMMDPKFKFDPKSLEPPTQHVPRRRGRGGERS